MSCKAYSTNTKKNVAKSEQKPFCKMCYDAKRSGYDTHYLKEFSGPTPVVTCPYLLALKCNYCKNSGHTISYCDVLKAKKVEDGGETTRRPTQNGHFFIQRGEKDSTTPVPVPAPIVERKQQNNTMFLKNKFGALDIQEEESEEEEVVQQELESEFSSSVMTWAKIVAKTPEKKEVCSKILQRPTTTQTKRMTDALGGKWEITPPIVMAEKKIAATTPSSSTLTTQQLGKLDQYFFKAASLTNWWNDDSDDEVEGF